MQPNTPKLADFLTARFRTADAYELVLFDRLSALQQTAFADLQRDPDFYGLLRPRHDSSRMIKAITRDSALLLLSLNTPGSLPFFVRREPNAAEAISDLVLTGVLEIEHGGEFVSGVAAASLLASSPASANRRRPTSVSPDLTRFTAERRVPVVARLVPGLQGI